MPCTDHRHVGSVALGQGWPAFPGSPLTPVSSGYLTGYPAELQDQANDLIARGELASRLRQRYVGAHSVRTDMALYDYTLALKTRYMRNADAVSKVVYDNRLQVVQNALGTHTTVSRVQGNRLKAKREIRIAGIFRTMPEPLLKMIVVHELAHLKERAHDKAFYSLCLHMEPDYHQLELDLRLCLLQAEATGTPVWPG